MLASFAFSLVNLNLSFYFSFYTHEGTDEDSRYEPTQEGVRGSTLPPHNVALTLDRMRLGTVDKSFLLIFSGNSEEDYHDERVKYSLRNRMTREILSSFALSCVSYLNKVRLLTSW